MIQVKTSLKLIPATIVLMLALTIAGPTLALPETKISFDSATISELQPGEEFTVSVEIADAVNLFGWQINVTFNPNILNASKVREGPFLKNVNDTIWTRFIDNSNGFVLAHSSLMPPYVYPTGAAGSGILANITFTVKSSGTSALHFDETMTKLRTLESGVLTPITGFTMQDSTYGSGGGGFLGGVPLEILAGIIAVAVVVVAVGIFFLRRRKEKAEGVVR